MFNSINLVQRYVASYVTCLLLFLLICSGTGFAQAPRTIDVKAGNVSIEKALNDLKNNYGISFVTETDGLDLTAPVNVKLSKTDLPTALKAIFAPQQIMVELDGNVVKIAAAKPEAGNGYILKGIVVDSNGETIPGATVIVKGRQGKGTVADFDGHFDISLDGASTLQCVCIGYEDQEMNVSARDREIRFVMKASAEFLDEAVVVGYGTMRRSMVSSAISKLSVEDDMIRDVISPAALLGGRVAGVNIGGGSGNLGSGERTVIRGISSLNAGNEPLYVVDGIPLTNINGNLTDFGESMSSLSVLALNDIESIEVLKDAASAAIYGSRASNGVILITTKSGRDGKSTARVNLSTGMSQFPNVGKIKMADSKLWLEVYNEGVDNYNKQYGYSIGDSSYKEHLYNPYGTLADMDWMNSITQIGYQYNVDASFSGGNKKTTYYIGANYNHKEGVIKTNKLDKANFKVKVQHDFTKWLEVGANASANWMKNYQVPGATSGTMIIGRALFQRPFDRVYAPDGSYNVGGTDALTYHNPVQVLNEETAYIENLRYIGTYHVALKFLNNKLIFKNSFNNDVLSLYDYTNYNENHPYGKGVGRIVEKDQTVMNLSFDSVLSYNDQFADGNVDFGAMLGHTFQKVDTRNLSLDGSGFPSASFDVVGVASEITSYGGNKYSYALESYFGRVNMGYKGRYTITATLRTDGSSKFQPSKRWGWFPSVSFGWNVGKEPWMQNTGVDMKVRASWGKTGNQAGIGTFASQSQMAGGKNYLGNSGIYSTVFGNDNLTWEKADQFDLGADFSFFDDRLTVIIDGYLKNTTDLLYAKPIFATSGTTSITSNVGSIRNSGVELTVGGSVNLGPVHWKTSFNIAHNKNVVTSLTGTDDMIAIGSNRVLKVGKEVGTFYLFKFDGLYQYDAEVPKALYDQGVRAGDIRYANLDGDEENLINDTDRACEYSPNPIINGGWSNTFSWNGLSLDLFFSYAYGNKVYFGQGYNLSRCSASGGVMEQYASHRWTGPGTTNVYPRAINGSSWNSKNSDYYIFDGSFIRLRSLTLSYSFNKKVLNKMKMKGLRLYVQGDNLFILTRYPGYDPEVSTDMDARFYGVDNINVPQPRTVSIGANLSF